MNVASFKSYMKQNGENLMSFSGIFCLVLSIWLIMSFNNKNELRNTDILRNISNISAVERGIVPKNLETLARLEDDFTVNERVKRDDQASNGEKIKEKQESARRRRNRDGTVYVRWGRKSCPDEDTELVYSGIAAGSGHGHDGAATNHQCLPENPSWGNRTAVAGGAFIYGMEYEEAFTEVMEMVNVVGKTLLNQNVPCAVCRRQKRTTYLMVPGVFRCYPGWHLEYNGYLLAGNHGSVAGTNYICVDNEPEVTKAGYRDEGGAHLYRVTAACGALPCPKYVNSRELPCVVCTK